MPVYKCICVQLSLQFTPLDRSLMCTTLSTVHTAGQISSVHNTPTVHSTGKIINVSNSLYSSHRFRDHQCAQLYLQLNETAVSWAQQLQKSVVLSTTEAEFVSTTEGAKELVWLKRLLTEIGGSRDVLTLLIDNAIKLVKNHEHHKRSKHIEVSYFFVREFYGMVILTWNLYVLRINLEICSQSY